MLFDKGIVMDQLSGLMNLALRVLPFLGLVVGLVMLVKGGGEESLPGHHRRILLRVLAVRLTGASIGLLVATHF